MPSSLRFSSCRLRGLVPALSSLWGQEQRLREVPLFVQGCTAPKGLTQGCILGFWLRGLCLKNCPTVRAQEPRSGPGTGVPVSRSWAELNLISNTRGNPGPCPLSAAVTVEGCSQPFGSPSRRRVTWRKGGQEGIGGSVTGAPPWREGREVGCGPRGTQPPRLSWPGEQS